MSQTAKRRISVLILLILAGSAIADQSSPQAVCEPNHAFLTDVFSHHWGYRTQIDLNGSWQFQRDPNDIGETQRWQTADVLFKDTMTIPGAPQAQGYGENNPAQKNYFWDQAFWVKRTFSVPELNRRRAWLRIGGILPAAKIYINNKYIGYTQSSRTQQRIDITEVLESSAENEIAVKVCKLPEIRLDGMYEWVGLGLAWTGVYRPVCIELTPEVSILSAHLIPDIDAKSVSVNYTLSAAAPKAMTIQFAIYDREKKLTAVKAGIPAGSAEGSIQLPFKKFQTWSPACPALYTLRMTLMESGSSPSDCAGIQFGMRKIETSAERFLLNNRRLYLRCFGDMALYADTLSPPADINWYLPRLEQAKKFGFNAIKCCVDTMSPDFLEAADRVGLMVIQEMPFGVGLLRMNRNVIGKPFRDYYAQELEGIVAISRNHPSVIAYSMSSELTPPEQVTQESFDFFSREMPQRTKALAPNALVIDCTGYVDSLETVKGTRVTDFYASIHPKWLKIVLDDADMATDHKRPLILHEFNWWSSYPDPRDRDKYAASQIKPFWIDTLVSTAQKNGQGELIQTYTANSRWLQWLCQKDGLEYARRKNDVQGFVFWSLIDYYRYSEGILDDFWNPKDVAADEFLTANGDTVIVLAKDGNRCFEAGSTVSIPLAISNYSEYDFKNPVLKWHIKELEQTGTMPGLNLPQGELTQLGSIAIPLPDDRKARKFVVQAELSDDHGIINTNCWSFWMFPRVKPEISEISSGAHSGKVICDNTFIRTGTARHADIPSGTSLVLADGADEKLADFVEQGGKCILIGRGMPIENKICYYEAVSFYTLFRTVPWNGGDSGNSGTIISLHPALYNFPHEGRCDLQFLSLIQGALPMHFEPLRSYGLNTPVVRAIDHFLANRNNAYMLEFTVGKGKVLATTFGILSNWKADKALGQWGSTKLIYGPNRKIEAAYLLECLLDYGRSSLFEPAAALPKDAFVTHFKAWRTSGNVLTNGAFEANSLSESAYDANEKRGVWYPSGDPNGAVYQWSISADKPHTGSGCLKLRLNEAADANDFGKAAENQGALCLYNDSDKFSGNFTDVFLEGWVNVEDLDDTMTCTIAIADSRKLNVDQYRAVGGEKGWKPFKLNLGKTASLSRTAPLEVKILAAPKDSHLPPGRGQAYFDDFKLSYEFLE